MKKHIRPLSDTERAYIAGILDGEGSISISRKTDPTMKSGHGYRLSIEIANTDENLMSWLQSVTGLGHVRKHARTCDRHKQAYRWNLWSLEAYQLLATIYQFLIVKRTRAFIAMRFVEEHSGAKPSLTAEQAAEQKAIYEEMKTLNKRGPA